MNTTQLTLPSFDLTPIAGTLTTVENMHTIFIPVHGSFVQNRDGDLDGTKKWMFPNGVGKRNLFADITKILLPLGVGSFCYDKRASGESGGIYENTDLTILAKDLCAVYEYIKKLYPNIKIVLLGQSEGAHTVLKATEMGCKPNHIILQGPPLWPWDRILEFQITHAAKPFLDLTNTTLEQDYPYITAFYRSMVYGDMMQKMLQTNDTHYTLSLNNWTHPTSLQKYREYLWDAKAMIKKINIPIHILFGELDMNTPPEPGREIIESKKAGEYKNVEVTILQDLEHSFRRLLPNDTFITVMSRPLDPEYIETIQSIFKSM